MIRKLICAIGGHPLAPHPERIHERKRDASHPAFPYVHRTRFEWHCRCGAKTPYTMETNWKPEIVRGSVG